MLTRFGILIVRTSHFKPWRAIVAIGNRLGTVLFPPHRVPGIKDGPVIPFFDLLAATAISAPRIVQRACAEVPPGITRMLHCGPWYLPTLCPAWANHPSVADIADAGNVNELV